MIRIGIDATAIPPNRAGAGNYIFNLVRAVAAVDRDNEYVVFAKPEHIAEWNLTQPNVTLRPAASRVRSARLAWEQAVLPWLVRRHGVQVLHSPHYTSPLAKPAASVVTFCDMIFWLYPEVHTRAKRMFFPVMMKASARTADRIITISQSTADDLRRLMPDLTRTDRIRPIPLAAGAHFRPVDSPEVERVCRGYGLQAGEYILYVGVIEPRKNLVRLLQAYRTLVDGGTRAPLVVVGRQGWMYEEVFRAVDELDLSGRVVFTGYVPEASLPALFCGAGVFVYPSLYEGFGLPVLEAMACGAPVVTGNVSSMPEIVGDAGRLVDPRDVEALSAALGEVLRDRNLRRVLGERGLDRAKQFSWERTARETVQVYLEAWRATQ